ncbi:MAG TPA: HPr family phosphocarrier protein [Acidiferrobacteraceae bacterium]|nr:HPr family phosphocarrier protein [Acidiferrobacteraceae bacterium]
MTRVKLKIINKLGLHARAAAKLVAMASQFESTVSIIHNDSEVNGKSIMGIMMLAAGIGAELELITQGTDEQAAADAIKALVNDRFGEDE